MQQKTLVLFDFDGTLTRGDSLLRFLLFAVPPAKLILGSVALIFKFLRLIWSGQWTNEKGKEALLSVFFKGQSFYLLDQLGAEFCRQKLPRMFRHELIAQLREYHESGATVAVVSASPDIWLRPFCAVAGIQMICTGLQYEHGIFTGKLATPNCNGHEKAQRVRAAFDLASFEKIIAYGNSAGDAAMLALADEAWMIRRGNQQIHAR